jgi:RNA polymerase sigma-70 factor (ECF subfamily)
MQRARRDLRDPVLAQDVVSEAWVRMWRARKTLNEPEAFVGWATQILRGATVDALRRQEVRNRHARAGADLDDRETTSPSDLLALKQLLEQAEVLLSTEEWQRLMSHVFLGETHEEIADRTLTNPATQRGRHQRILAKLRAALVGWRSP